MKGVHFYGFHANYAPFLKVHIANPAFVNRAVTIMQSGTVMSTRFRVYESHLSYILQFLSDFGLYGCGWIDLGEVWQRGRDEVLEEKDTGPNDTGTTFKDSPYFRQTRMPLEVDAAAHQILNRHKIGARNMHHRLTIPAPPLPPEPLVLGVRELWEDERQRRLAKGLSPSPEIPKDPSAKSRGPGGEWVAEARWWEEVRKRIERERGREVIPPKMSWEKWVMTTFESVEALWEDEYKTWRPNAEGSFVATGSKNEVLTQREANPYLATQAPASQSEDDVERDDQGGQEVDVDETMLASQDMSRLMEREEAEWQKEASGHYEPENEDPFPDDDEEAVEDGPPPDLQSEKNDPEDRYAGWFLGAKVEPLTQVCPKRSVRCFQRANDSFTIQIQQPVQKRMVQNLSVGLCGEGCYASLILLVAGLRRDSGQLPSSLTARRLQPSAFRVILDPTPALLTLASGYSPLSCYATM